MNNYESYLNWSSYDHSISNLIFDFMNNADGRFDEDNVLVLTHHWGHKQNPNAYHQICIDDKAWLCIENELYEFLTSVDAIAFCIGMMEVSSPREDSEFTTLGTNYLESYRRGVEAIKDHFPNSL